jgi:hypothetical protein
MPTKGRTSEDLTHGRAHVYLYASQLGSVDWPLMVSRIQLNDTRYVQCLLSSMASGLDASSLHPTDVALALCPFEQRLHHWSESPVPLVLR